MTKHLFKILIFLLLLPSVVFGQVHNQLAGLGTQGEQILGNTTDGTLAINTSGKWGQFAVSTTGKLFIDAAGSGLATSANQETEITSLQLLDDAVATNGSAIPAKSFQVSGSDGTNARALKTDSSGNLQSVILDAASSRTASVLPLSIASTYTGFGVGNMGWIQAAFDSAETGSTTTVVNATSHSAKVGDLIYFTAGTSQYASSPVQSVAANTITVSNAFPVAPANGNAFLIFRPVPWTFGVGANSTNSIPFVNLDLDNQNSIQKGILKDEDRAALSLDAGVPIFGKLQSAITSDAAADDYSWFKADTGGRTITAPAPAGEMWVSCGTATASTADVAIKALVASNRIYVSSVTCASSDADNATNINFKDASTVIAVGGVNQMATTSAGTFTASFPTPLRLASGTAFNFNTAVSTSSVICCGAGWISTI